MRDFPRLSHDDSQSYLIAALFTARNWEFNVSKLVIVGGGFAGVAAAVAAAYQAKENGGDIAITLISRDGFITNRPRLYEAHSEHLRAALCDTLEPIGVELVLGEVSAIDAAGQSMTVNSEGAATTDIAYDRLVLAAGSLPAPFDIPGAEHAWDIDDYQSAQQFESHVQETASRDGRAYVVVGAGLTGLELATEMRGRLGAHGGVNAAADARVILLERRRAVGPQLADEARAVVDEALQKAGVEVMLESGLQTIEKDAAILEDGTRIEPASVIITAGLRASPLAAAFGGETDGLGRLRTEDTLRVAGFETIFAAGDLARAAIDDKGRAALMSCQHAGVMGRVAGHNAARDLMGLGLMPYRQERYVTCIDLGPAGALFTTGWERELSMKGDEAKALKRQIVEARIMPPTGSAADILATGKLDAA